MTHCSVILKIVVNPDANTYANTYKRNTLSTRLFVLSMAFFFLSLGGCDRLKKEIPPDGVPADAVKDRVSGLWEVTTASGLYLAYYGDGALAQRGHLVGERREGIWRSYALDGKTITASGEYRNDRRDKVWKFYDGQGRLYLTLRYRPKPVRTFGFLVLRDYGNENGPYVRYFPDGSVEERGFFAGGYYQGPVRRDYRNGKPAMSGRYDRDKKVGRWIYYYPEGSVERIEEYRDGHLNGILTNYRPDGRIYQRVVYHDGKPVRTLIHPSG